MAMFSNNNWGQRNQMQQIYGQTGIMPSTPQQMQAYTQASEMANKQARSLGNINSWNKTFTNSYNNILSPQQIAQKVQAPVAAAPAGPVDPWQGYQGLSPFPKATTGSTTQNLASTQNQQTGGGQAPGMPTNDANLKDFYSSQTWQKLYDMMKQNGGLNR